MLTELLAFTVLVLAFYIVYIKVRWKFKMRRRVKSEKDKARKDALEKSRASIKGKVSEQFAPFYNDFSFKASDARFLGSPIDYIIFKGYSDGDDVEVILSDVKTGENAKLTEGQKKIKEAVENNKVRWKTLEVEK